MRTITRRLGSMLIALLAGLSLLGATPANAQGSAADQLPPPARARATDGRVPMKEILRNAEPLAVPTAKRAPARQDEARGKPLTVPGTTPDGSAAAAASTSTSLTSTNSGSLWPGANNKNPNRQTGKLFFDRKVGAGTDWSHCSGTAINTGNRSLVVTAGHCVFQPDPDRDGLVEGNGYYYEDFRFCPGYEDPTHSNSCALGVWKFRVANVTPTWYYGVNGRYDWQDDFAVVVVKPNTSGYLTDVVGSQGITFNQATGIHRTLLGYPAPDSRWPGYSYNGHDLYYCQGNDKLGATRVSLHVGCTMTGGASGGPWLSWVATNWLGYVNGVNSHKVDPKLSYDPNYTIGATWMASPYFGNAEKNLFQSYRSA